MQLKADKNAADRGRDVSEPLETHESHNLREVVGAAGDNQPILKERLTMSSRAVSVIVFACVFGGAMCGMVLGSALPQDHLSADSKDVVRLGMGLVSTMAALVLGLLVSSAKGFYDAQNTELMQVSAAIILVDRLLAHYGPGTTEVRDQLRDYVADSIDRIWPREHTQSSRPIAPTTCPEVLIGRIQALSPKDDRQRSVQAQALSLAMGLIQTRWLMYEQGANSVSGLMIAILVFWLAAIFISFGLFAPRNATVITALLVAGSSVSGAIFLILEMYTPFGGLIRISSAPLRATLAQLGQ
jgi:hypothetical protein